MDSATKAVCSSDAIALSDSDVKRKFFEVCRKSFRLFRSSHFPVNFEDWKVCVLLLFQMGFVYLYDKDVCQKIVGKRCNISLHVLYTNTNGRFLHVSLNPQYPQANVKRSCVYPIIRPNVDIGRLERLELLRIGGRNADASHILDVLSSIDFCDAENLQKLVLNCRSMDSNNVETLFFQVLPRFPNLVHLDMSFASTDISGFKVIADRIRSEKSRIASTSLRTVSFSSPLCSAGTAEILRNLLKLFVTLDSVGVPCYKSILADKDLEYPLMKNMVGRRILKGNDIPLSLWPIVLNRAQNKVTTARHVSDFWTTQQPEFIFSSVESRARMKATGIYYLLRNGSALIGRNDLDDKSNSYHSNTNSPSMCKKRNLNEV